MPQVHSDEQYRGRTWRRGETSPVQVCPEPTLPLCRVLPGTVIPCIVVFFPLRRSRTVMGNKPTTDELERKIIELNRELDRDAFTTFVNPRTAEMLGYSQDEMIGMHVFEFIDGKDADIVKFYHQKADGRRRNGPGRGPGIVESYGGIFPLSCARATAEKFPIFPQRRSASRPSATNRWTRRICRKRCRRPWIPAALQNAKPDPIFNGYGCRHQCIVLIVILV